MVGLDAGGLIAAARKGAGLTQAQLAERAGTSQPAVARYESGITSPAVSTLNRLLKACGQTVSARLESASSTNLSSPQAQALRRHRGEVLKILRGIGATNVQVFGSVARGDVTPDSDIDLLVDFDVARGIFNLWEANDAIAELLGYKVDLAPRTFLKPLVLEAAQRDALPL